MQTLTEKPLLDLIADATDLAENAQPTTNCVLTVLTAFSTEDVRICVNKQQIPMDIVSNIEKKTGIKSFIVHNVLMRSVLPGIIDYSAMYSKAIEDYNHLEARREEVHRAMNRDYITDVRFCVHGEILNWISNKNLLAQWRGRDEAFTSACIGYLVSHNLAFSNVIEILRESRLKKWPEWESLWRYF